MKSLASLTVAMLALVALIFISQSSPVDAFTIYRIGSDADWLMSSDEGDDDDDFHYADSESEYDEEGMPQNDVAAFDQDSLDDAELVVDEDEVLPAWRGVPAEGVELAQEVVVESYTSFVIDLDDPGTPPIDPDDLKPEQFGPPTFYLANRGMPLNLYDQQHVSVCLSMWMCVCVLRVCGCGCALRVRGCVCVGCAQKRRTT